MLGNVLAAICFALLPPAAADVPSPPPTGPIPTGAVTPAAVDAFVAEYREKTGLPGAAVAITKGTEVIHAAGYGETAAGDPVTADTPMAVASVSKSFTSLAVMQLVEKGEVDLDRPVRGYLPEFTMADPRAARITVRQLLNQTSGMADSAFREKSLPQPGTLEGAVARLRTAELAADPGTVFSYHNTNYQVAARLVEVVSGEPFAGYLRAHVFAPLGMRNSTTIDTDRDLPDSARGHLYILGQAVALPEPTGFGNGSGGVLSSANDMARWLIAQNNGILSPASITEMRTPSEQDEEYALGWSIGETERGTPVVRHGGDLFTSTAEQLLMPVSGYGVAVMANTGMAFADSGALMDALVAMVEGGAPEIPSSPYLVTDIVFALMTLVTIGLAARGVARSRRWAARRTGWQRLRLLPWLAPLALCVTVVPIFRVLARGSDIMWIQVVYLYPTFMIWLVTATVAGLALVIARLVRRGGHTARPSR
ncbi:serine hydrolase domain-containing protein [Streptosporangium roseum]|uniref:Beta-lactamase class C and other penicillin binding protein-like protein n=1 Tax=Streptosporangium roseum (strain ATCC 12428 / DSM 43021 / JCM 3005 / KCTC 9067 / NCIMB 10171 / NRRL 2505 / NI 9100) TaxID=479432 RepID=D2B5Q3_STRRD|nr:serine hydrolase domain-containing protein [Streptosporangium roseum]ACZ91357.1 Beta-lactamase class C and other penicillin binding protein-like protein [Streptosporangium roseum DSM 43021]